MNGGGGRVVQCNIEESRGKRGSLATLTHFYVCLSVRLPAWVTCHVAGQPRPRASQGHGRIPHRANTVYWLWPWCHTDTLVYTPSCLPAYWQVVWYHVSAGARRGTSRPRPHPSRPSVYQPTIEFDKSLFTYTRVILLVWLPDLYKKRHYYKMIPLMAAAIELLYLQSWWSTYWVYAINYEAPPRCLTPPHNIILYLNEISWSHTFRIIAKT